MTKRIISIFAVMLLLFSLSACSNSSNEETTTQTTTQLTTESTSAQTQEINDVPSEDQKPGAQDAESAKIAVVYFSATGKTKAVAQAIAQGAGADLFEIEPVKPYTSDDLSYDNDNCRANVEQNDASARPEIRSDLGAIGMYDTVYLGYPIWWGTNPRIIQTFLDSYDLSRARVYLFCTSGSSDIDKSVSDLQKAYPNLNIVTGKRFASASSKDVNKWIKNNK